MNFDEAQRFMDQMASNSNNKPTVEAIIKWAKLTNEIILPAFIEILEKIDDKEQPKTSSANCGCGC